MFVWMTEQETEGLYQMYVWDYRLRRWEARGTGPGFFPMAGYGISGDGSSGCATTELAS
jgi:hypothetical protein